MIDRKELKTVAKMRIRLTDPSCWKVMLLWLLAGLLVPMAAWIAVIGSGTGLFRFFALVANGFDPDLAVSALSLSPAWVLICVVLYILTIIYSFALSFGVNVYCLHVYRGEACGPGDLFSGFSMLGRVIGAQLLVALFEFGWMLLVMLAFSLVLGLLAAVSETLAAVLAIPMLIAFYVLVIAIVLRYALVNFALADRPELGALGTIRYAKDLIKGHIFDYFVLNLSFVGWYLLIWLGSYLVAAIVVALAIAAQVNGAALIAISLILGVVLGAATCLWLTPYIMTTQAGYYDALCGGQDERLQSSWTPGNWGGQGQ